MAFVEESSDFMTKYLLPSSSNHNSYHALSNYDLNVVFTTISEPEPHRLTIYKWDALEQIYLLKAVRARTLCFSVKIKYRQEDDTTPFR